MNYQVFLKNGENPKGGRPTDGKEKAVFEPHS